MSELPPHEMRRLRAVARNPAHLAELVDRRREGEPLQYLEGSAAFGPIDLVVDHRVLVPRPETERLWELAVASVSNPRLIVDLCTGSGALAIALARRFPDARVIGADLSDDALAVARLNGSALAPQVEWRSGDLFEALDPTLQGEIDLLVSNPPYVAEAEWDVLPADVRREPRMALIAGPTGLEVLARIAAEAITWLRPGGRIWCEIGERQAPAARDLFGNYTDVVVVRDFTDRYRYLTATR